MQWFNNLQALPKLVLSFGLLTLLNALTGVIALERLNSQSDQVVAAYSRDIEGMSQVDSIALAKLAMARLTRDALIKIDNKAVVEQDIAAFDTARDATQENIDQARAAFKGEEGSAQIEEISALFPTYIQLCDAILQKARAGDSAAGVKALADVDAIAKKLNADTAEAAAAKRRLATRNSIKSQEDFRGARALLIAMVAVCALLGTGLSVWIGRLFSRPLGLTVALLRQVAEGDLTGALDLRTDDEVGQMALALNEALGKMRIALVDVKRVSQDVRGASGELATSSKSIAAGSQQQAASLEETAASLEQITATVRQSADNARQANLLAHSSQESAELGGRVVADAVAAMAEINAASAKIAEIIASIDGIAFQTNLLAVNASVEAARAGDFGRGFAVVAAEVRQLALRSASSAKEIKGLIADSLKKVDRGAALVNRSGETLETIVESVKRVGQIVGEIAAAAAEQSTGIEQVNLAMAQMDQVTQTNSAATEHLAATAGSLAEQSETLIALVGNFAIGDAEAPRRNPPAAEFASRKQGLPAVMRPVAHSAS